jgi:enoyl-CoA hydratase
MNIELHTHQGLALLTINRPQALNALSFALIAEFAAAVDAVAASDARALIITGAGENAFCAGADIKELTGRTLSEQKRGAELGQAALAKLDALPVPSIALVNGYAFGGGCELALACTFRLATANAKFGLPEVKLGLIPGYGGTQRLPRLIGEARAMELILTGRTVGAEEALRVGLANRIIEPPALDGAIAFARELTGFSKVTSQFARLAVQRAGYTSLLEGLRAEADLSTLAYQTQDAAEGMQAFLEKRAPRFEDR